MYKKNINKIYENFHSDSMPLTSAAIADSRMELNLQAHIPESRDLVLYLESSIDSYNFEDIKFYGKDGKVKKINLNDYIDTSDYFDMSDYSDYSDNMGGFYVYIRDFNDIYKLVITYKKLYLLHLH